MIVGETATFTCNIVRGDPPPILAWTFEDVIIQTSEKYSTIVNANMSTLTIYNTSLSDAGSYICHATNIIGNDSIAAHLGVFSKSS